ncbi:MAG: CvpA family protein [Planctomycetales bacterium]
MQYDLVVVLVLVLATVHGAYRGFVSQLATIAALVLAFAFAGPVSSRLAPFLALEPPLDRWVAMLAAYVVLSLGCFMIARTLRGAIDKARLGDYDRHLGAVFGFLKGGVFCLVLTFFLVTLFENSRPYIVGTPQGHPSKTGWISALILDRLYPVVPPEFSKTVDSYLHRYDGAGVAFEHEHEEGHAHAANMGPIADTSGDAGDVRRIADPSYVPQPAAPEYRALLAEVVALYARDRAEREQLLFEVEEALAELPAEMAEAVVWDWHADLLATFADPDSETDASWSLGERMLRQLTLADTAAARDSEPVRRTARDPRR